LTSVELVSALRVLGFTVSRMSQEQISLVRGRRSVTIPRIATLDAEAQRALLQAAGVSETDFAVVAFTHSAGAIPIASRVMLDELRTFEG
jgi:hypothetical protein